MENSNQSLLNNDSSNERIFQENKLVVVIANLPKMLSECVSLMDTIEEIKMILYSLTTITGSLMPKVWFNYAGKINFPALMTLISFPPASGKGKLSLLSLLLTPITKELKEQNSIALRKYDAEQKLYERNHRTVNIGEPPQKPNLPILVVPGNTTSSKLIEQLAENDGKKMVLLFETETDALTNMMHNKFGSDNSVILRKAYHHETISQMRKHNAEHLEVTSPKMAIVVSGTESQIPKLFHSNQDGLLSRFLIVKGDAPLIWKNVKPCDVCTPLNFEFEKLAKDFYQLYKFYELKNVEVKFTNSQWDKINKIGEQWLMQSNEEAGENATSIAKRHPNMALRIASVFTMVRYYEEKREDLIVYCSDTDFNNANWMMEESYKCSLEVFHSLPGKKKENDSRIEEFYNLIPNEFQTKELAPIQEQMKIAERTKSRFLKQLVESGRLTSPKKGFYQKVSMADLADGTS